MTIKEFIEHLNQYDPDMTIKIYDIDRKGNIHFLDVNAERDITEYEGDFLGVGGY